MTFPVSNGIARELDDRWKETQALFQQWWYEADLDTKMATGQQDYWNTFYNINYRNQKILMFNKILRIINMIGGYQRDNRLATIIQPSDNDPDNGHTADQLTKIMSWVIRQDQSYERYSDVFDASNTCGMNLLQVYMDFREDPENGMIKTYRYPFNSFLMDPYWQDFNKDCGWVWTRRYVTKDVLMSLQPSLKKELPYLGKGYSSKDGKFQFLAQNWYQYQQEMYAYDEYWKKDYKDGFKLLDKSSGEVADWSGTREQFKLFRQYNPNIELIKAKVPTLMWHVLVNNHEVYEEKTPFGLDRLPFACNTCYHFPEVQNYAYRYQGVVRNIRDSQIELNRRRNRLLDILDAQIQSGLMVKEDSLVNPEDAFFEGPGKILFFKQTANLATDQMQFQAPALGSGWLELIQSIEKEIMDIVGPEELFAQNMGAKEMTGVLMKLKMGAGLTGLRNIFDRMNQFQMNAGDIKLDLILNNFSIGKIRNILGEEPSEILQKVLDPENQLRGIAKDFIKYQCVVEEQELTATQRQLQFMNALQLKQLGIPISNKYILEKSTLQGKKEIMDDIEAQEKQQMQMQQQQFQSEMQQSEMLAMSLKAKARSDEASANERDTRSIANIAQAKEHVSEAVHERAAAALDNAKALKEIDEMDENRLMKLADFILSIQERQKNMEGGEEEDSVEIAHKATKDSTHGDTEANRSSNSQGQQPLDQQSQ